MKSSRVILVGLLMSSLPLLGVMTAQSRTRSNKRQAQTSATTINVAKEQTYGEDAKPTQQVTRTSDGQRITLPGQSNVTSLTSHPELRSDQTDNLNNTVSAVFGRNVFSSQGLTFEPNENMATPQNYRLGPNDEVLIDIWGESEDHISQVISPEGSIMISQIGPVYLSGMTISEANNHIKSLFAKKYAGVGETTDINVTLGEIRSIQVDVMGEVATPGTYRLSPFSSVFHALYNAGGINDIGSLRNITVMRNGKNIGNIDVYDYLFKGRPSKNIRLQEGDVILVPTYNELVTINGNVKRPMRYELKTTETIDDLIKYAGGYTGDAYSGMVRLNRQNGAEKELFNVEKSQFSRYRLQDGDVVSVGTVLDEFNNRVNISGAVMRPDFYALGSDVKTLTQLIKAADGLTEDAFTDRMLIYREGPDLTVETISVNYNDILNGSAKDITLKKNDVVRISSVLDLNDRGTLRIQGEVQNPNTFPFTHNTTVADLILMSGGLREGASTARCDVSRRIVDPKATVSSDTIARIYSLNIGPGSNGGKFLLEPYDIVTVRKSPTYLAQGTVNIDGEVEFTGNYTLSSRNERISEIVSRAGGLMESAYVRGATLTRRLSDDEANAYRQTIKLAMANNDSEGDSISMAKINRMNRYSVGIDLEKALANPGTADDPVMKPGDHIFIPQEQSTVKVSGDVLFPNTVTFVNDKKVKYYIEQAGGYGHQAKKGSTFIIYANGTVEKVNRKTVVEPGCNIIVPSKHVSQMELQNLLQVSTTMASLSTTLAIISNLFK